MWGYSEYVPIAKRKAQAKSKIKKLKQQGKEVYPVEIEGRAIAKKFWGKKWCEHLETFADYENRLPRGRTYVRNGSVCHLDIKRGYIEALISGSSLYKVNIEFKPLKEKHWNAIKNKCSGEIGSVLEILKGQISDNIMSLVADPNDGIFPTLEDIKVSCTCLDWADLCKHALAALYGIGNRLDTRPDLLFLLRSVDPEELIVTQLTTEVVNDDNLLQSEELSDIFGIDIDEAENTESIKDKSSSQNCHNIITGKDLKRLRLKMGLSVKEFAKELGMTSAALSQWEKVDEPLH